MRNRVLLPILLLLSGFCGISYEVLYGRLLGNLIGDQFDVTATVLLTLLLGSAIGTRFAHHLWRRLWLIEAGIGVSGAVLAVGSPVIEDVVYRLGGTPAATMGCGLLALLPPALLIGCSVPLFAGYLWASERGDGGQSGAFAKVYTVYNFGAALTALLSEFALVRLLGLQRTILVVASMNVLVSAVLAIAFRNIANDPPPPAPRPWVPGRRREAWALGLAGVASATFQLLAVKVSESFLGPFRETFALVLAVVLLGIAFGTLTASRLRLHLEVVLVGAVAGLSWILFGFGRITTLYARLYPRAAEHPAALLALNLSSLLVLIGPAVSAFGATIPVLLRSSGEVSRESGRLLFVASLANALGFLLTVTVLHATFDYGELVLVVAAIVGVSVFLVRGVSRRWDLAASALLVLVCVSKCLIWNEGLLYLGYTAFHSPEALASEIRAAGRLETFRDHQDSFAIKWSHGRPFFYINGYISCPLRTPAETIVGAFASVFAPRLDDALVLGVGSGATAGAVARLFEHEDGVEINQAVLDNLARMHPFNFEVDRNPRVRLIHDDAIHFLRSHDATYSLILNTVTSPLYFSSSKLYTREFLASVRSHLRPDGVYATWFDSRVGDAGAATILRTLRTAFSSCALGAIKSSYFLLICSNAPIAIRHPFAPAREARLGRYLLAEYGVVPEWISSGLLIPDAFQLLGSDEAAINSLDLPALEFQMAQSRRRAIPKLKAKIGAAFRWTEVRERLGSSSNPVHYVLHQEMLLGDSRIERQMAQEVSAHEPDFEQRLAGARVLYEQFMAERVRPSLARLDP